MNLLRIILFSRTALFGGGDTTPGGTNSVLLLANGTDGLLLADGSSFLKLAG